METNPFREINFLKNKISYEEKTFYFYSSPILLKNNFKHGFFTKSISKENLQLHPTFIKQNHCNCFLKQIHSSKIVFGSNTQGEQLVEADGIVSDKPYQNLWVYTADCMPIFIADKRIRIVAAIHCGRKGLEKKIIRNLINIFEKIGSSKNDIVVAIGPSISSKNYLIDKKTLKTFYKNSGHKVSNTPSEYTKNDSIPLDLRNHAQIQLLNENIPNTNIEISNICTYEINNGFNSWRRNKTSERQWSYISS